MEITVCDMCGNIDEPVMYICSLCQSDLCGMFECAITTIKHGIICVACCEECPLSDFTEQEIKELNIQ